MANRFAASVCTSPSPHPASSANVAKASGVNSREVEAWIGSHAANGIACAPSRIVYARRVGAAPQRRATRLAHHPRQHY